MPIIEYPFQAKGFTKLSPILPIIIVNPDNGFVFPTWGLIDTGADDTSIPEHIAKKLGHDIKSVRPYSGYAAGGIIDVYKHTFSIDILSMNENGQVNENDTIIKISRRRIGVISDLHCVLLGVEDFLKKYVVTIDYPRQVFSIRKPKRK